MPCCVGTVHGEAMAGDSFLSLQETTSHHCWRVFHFSSFVSFFLVGGPPFFVFLLVRKKKMKTKILCLGSRVERRGH